MNLPKKRVNLVGYGRRKKAESSYDSQYLNPHIRNKRNMLQAMCETDEAEVQRKFNKRSDFASSESDQLNSKNKKIKKKTSP